MDEIFDCTGIFDSHAHYFDKRFERETEGADYILQNAVFERGIEGVINIGTNIDNSRICISQAAKYDRMYATVGIHPEDSAYCKKAPDEELSELYELIDTAEKIKQNKIVAIGEIGLDYHFEGFEATTQKYYFEKQLQMAAHTKLPVVIHDREAHGDCFDTVMKYPQVKGVFHSFSGSAEMARQLSEHGWYISFSGVLTFKNAHKTVEVAKILPLDKILIETDCPYLAPHPFRGKINHSGLMRLTAERLAEIKNVSVEEIIDITRDNTKRLFQI